MFIVNAVKNAINTDYKNLNKIERTEVHHIFTSECIRRINWITAVAFLAEIVIMILDFSAGFFNKNTLNYLNLLAEILIIISSLVVNIISDKLIKSEEDNHAQRFKTMFSYKVILFISIGLFIFTDIYVRHRPLGAYIVFIFIFEIVPFYRAVYNFILYICFISLVTFSYIKFIPGGKLSSLFNIVFVFIAFMLSTECLRSFFIKKIINSRLNKKMTKKFEKLASQTIEALSNSVEAKDMYTKGHSKRVAKYSCEIARRIGYPEDKIDEIYYIGLLHDIGKIGVPDTVINFNGRLNDEQFELIKKHPITGYEILKNITEISDISVGARWHHEKYDGSGYPDGLKGEQIPRIAQIIAVADAYDAMTSNRSYREVMPQNKVVDEIEKNIGKQFAPDIAYVMLQMIDDDVEYKMHE